MMKNNPKQIDLFSQGYEDAPFDNSSQEEPNPQLLKKIHNYQGRIVYLIGVIFVSLLSFSFGLEKGRKIINVTRTQPEVIAVQDQRVPQVAKESAAEKIVVPKEKPSIVPAKGAKDLKKSAYTIQIASLKKKNSITKELSKLKNKGHSAFSLPKGKYTLICIGSFKNKDDARTYFLRRVKSSYPDSQIRRL